MAVAEPESGLSFEGDFFRSTQEALDVYTHPGTCSIEERTDDAQHIIAEPDFSAGRLKAAELTETQERKFQHGLKNPMAVSVGCSEYASIYNVYLFEGEEEADDKHPAIAVSCPLTSSISKEQGERTIRQIRRRFPERKIIGIGSEETSDVKAAGPEREYSPETVPFDTCTCILEALERTGSTTSVVDLVGQSRGAVNMFETANLLQRFQQETGISVGTLTMVGPPEEHMGAFELTRRMLAQESKGIMLDSSWQKQCRLLGHIARDVIPELWGRDAGDKLRADWRQLRFVAGTSVRAASLEPGIRAILITSGKDKMSQFDGFLRHGPPPYGNKIVGMTVKGREGHSDFILNADCFGGAMELMYKL